MKDCRGGGGGQAQRIRRLADVAVVCAALRGTGWPAPRPACTPPAPRRSTQVLLASHPAPAPPSSPAAPLPCPPAGRRASRPSAPPRVPHSSGGTAPACAARAAARRTSAAPPAPAAPGRRRRPPCPAAALQAGSSQQCAFGEVEAEQHVCDSAPRHLFVNTPAPLDRMLVSEGSWRDRATHRKGGAPTSAASPPSPPPCRPLPTPCSTPPPPLLTRHLGERWQLAEEGHDAGEGHEVERRQDEHRAHPGQRAQVGQRRVAAPRLALLLLLLRRALRLRRGRGREGGRAGGWRGDARAGHEEAHEGRGGRQQGAPRGSCRALSGATQLPASSRAASRKGFRCHAPSRRGWQPLPPQHLQPSPPPCRCWRERKAAARPVGSRRYREHTQGRRARQAARAGGWGGESRRLSCRRRAACTRGASM